MRVYHPTGKAHTLFVTPASDPRAQAAGFDSDWLEHDGSPRMIAVTFDKKGMAIVPSSVGRYLTATKQASALHLPFRRVAA